MTPTEVKQAADEMVEMFKNFFRGYGISFDYDGWQLYKNEVNKQSTRIAIAHCKRVIKEWGCAYGMVAPQYQTECASKIKYYQSILSELEGRVK